MLDSFVLQTEETEAEAVSVSDDDFQDEFGFTRRTAAHVAERKSAQQGNAKVRVSGAL